MPRDGRYIERVGSYNPMLPQEHPDRVKLNDDRIKHWLGVGAKPSDRVARFLGQAEIIPMPAISETPKKSAPRAKTLERMREAEAAAEAAAEAKANAAAAPDPTPTEEEAAAEETPAAEASTEETPAEEASAEEAPAEEAAVEGGEVEEKKE
jgi:small subunit ribosomal protein S16